MSTPIQFIDKGPMSTLRVRTKKRTYLKLWDGRRFAAVYGLFYNSWDKQRHIAPYVPYRIPPRDSGVLCGAVPINFSPTRGQNHLCPVCLERFHEQG